MMKYYRKAIITDSEKEIIKNLKDISALESLGNILYQDVWEEVYEEA